MPGGLASNSVEGKDILWLSWKLSDGLCNFPNQIQLNTESYSHHPAILCFNKLPDVLVKFAKYEHFINEGF